MKSGLPIPPMRRRSRLRGLAAPSNCRRSSGAWLKLAKQSGQATTLRKSEKRSIVRSATAGSTVRSPVSTDGFFLTRFTPRDGEEAGGPPPNRRARTGIEMRSGSGRHQAAASLAIDAARADASMGRRTIPRRSQRRDAAKSFEVAIERESRRAAQRSFETFGRANRYADCSTDCTNATGGRLERDERANSSTMLERVARRSHRAAQTSAPPTARRGRRVETRRSRPLSRQRALQHRLEAGAVERPADVGLARRSRAPRSRSGDCCRRRRR